MRVPDLFETDQLVLPTIDIGDKLLVGKFKNRKADVKGFTTDDHNQPVLKTTKGDQKLFKPRLVKLMTEADNGDEFYVHVSPIKNLKSIVAKGLLPNVGGGNYTGFETSLSGTYVTRVPDLIHQHINARDMRNGFILVVVTVPKAQGVLDEDALNDWLRRCIDESLRLAGLDLDSAMSDHDPDDDIWKAAIPCFKTQLGQPNRAVLRRNPKMIEEYFEMVIHDLYGEDVDPGWWKDAKEQIMMAFPRITHPEHGDRYSLRLPGAVGYTGATRIVAVIAVRHGAPKLVKGNEPWGARALIDACLG